MSIVIPQEIENIILDFKHQQLFAKVMDELKEVFEICCCCEEQKVTYFNDTCDGCDRYICSECYIMHKHEPDHHDISLICNECYYGFLDDYGLHIDWMNF